MVMLGPATGPVNLAKCVADVATIDGTTTVLPRNWFYLAKMSQAPPVRRSPMVLLPRRSRFDLRLGPRRNVSVGSQNGDIACIPTPVLDSGAPDVPTMVSLVRLDSRKEE